MKVNSIDDIKCFVTKSADARLAHFCSLGHAVAGNNGPHGHPDTPVRNTCHWLIIYAYLWKTTKDEKYYDVCSLFIDYLLDESMFGKNGAVKVMETARYNHINGLIGQAWYVEALVYAFETFGEIKIINSAVRVFKSQNYNLEKHYWEMIEINGENLGVDRVFNHQLWFAASGLMILKHIDDEEIRFSVDDFLRNVETEGYFRVYSNGLIKHYIVDNTETKQEPFSRKIKEGVKKACPLLLGIHPNRFDALSIEKGYQLFDLYGFALLHYLQRDLNLLSSERLNAAIRYAFSEINLNTVFSEKVNRRFKGKFPFNKYMYGYNSPAFEYPFVSKMLTNYCSEKTMVSLFNIQLELTNSGGEYSFNCNNNDEETLTARLYELIRYF